MKLAVIIPAAGSSTRFGFGDKLSQDLGGRAILLRAVEAFTKRDETTGIIVAAPPDDLDGFKQRFGQASRSGAGGNHVVHDGNSGRW